MERQLAAILVADMAGYSRLMEQDELDVLERQKAHRRELIDLRSRAAAGTSLI
jgi:class 3 adenylate cyclase